MTEPRALLDAYAAEIVDVESEWGVFEPIKRTEAAEAAFTALRAVLDLHAPEDLSSTFAAHRNFVCSRCIGSDEELLPYPCDTVRAITTALEAK